MSILSRALVCAAALLGVGACATPSATPSLPAPSQARTQPQASGLTAGYASVDMTWRAGAKPGQVGTEAAVVPVGLLWWELIDVLLKAYRYQDTDPEYLLEYATDWAVDHVNGQLERIPYDDYAQVFQPGRGVQSPSYANAIVVENGGKKAAIVRADLYLMQKTIWRRVAELVEPATGLTADQIIISATHNHSAADAAFTAAGISTLAENFDPRHFVWVTQRIADAIIAADQARVPARMGAIRSTLRAIQRNVIGPATADVIPPGGTTPETIQAGFPRDYFDDSLWIVSFHDAQTNKRMFAQVIYGIHGESLYDGHGLLSSDFVGGLEAGLAARWGVPVMYSPGTMGDIEQDSGDNFGVDYWREDFARLDQQVSKLVSTIGPILEGPSPTDTVLPLSSDVKVNAIARVFPGPENLSYPGRTPYRLPVTEYLSPDWPVTCARALTETTNLLLQVVQVGDIVYMAAPSETITDVARHIRSRVDNVEGNLWQGYIWPGAPAWVADAVNQNFDPEELGAQEGFVMPILLNQSNDYSGYMVTRWEFVNRHHYRQEMTLFGEETTNYMAARFAGLARELRGAAPETLEWDSPSLLDLELEDEVYASVANLEPLVASWAKAMPSDDLRQMGRVLLEPTLTATDELGVPAVHFGWRGGASDLGLPLVAIDQDMGNGVWKEVESSDGLHLWRLYAPGGQWEAVWHVTAGQKGNFRFRIKGLYRSDLDGSSVADPVWDPDGRNAPYQVVSASFALN